MHSTKWHLPFTMKTLRTQFFPIIPYLPIMPHAFLSLLKTLSFVLNFQTSSSQIRLQSGCQTVNTTIDRELLHECLFTTGVSNDRSGDPVNRHKGEICTRCKGRHCQVLSVPNICFKFKPPDYNCDN